MPADVIQLFPTPPQEEEGQGERSCVLCEHAITSPDGTYCRLFGEEVLLEKAVAEECEEFVRDPHKD